MMGHGAIGSGRDGADHTPDREIPDALLWFMALAGGTSLSAMPDRHTLAETERVTGARLAHLDIDFGAANGVLSIHRAANAARGHLTATVLRPAGLTWTGFLVLWIVWIWDSMETRHIAESVGISKATLTGVTNTLVDRGWVRRVPSTQDRRLVSLELTDEGSALLDELFPKFNAVEAQIVRAFEGAELDELTTSLRKVVQSIEELDSEAVAD